MLNTERMLRLGALGAALAVLLAGLVIAVWPEPPARPLVGVSGWTASETIGRLGLTDFPEKSQQLRRSVQQNGGVLFRTWTPQGGAQGGTVESPPFRTAPYMTIAIAGATETRGGGVTAYLSCASHVQRLPVFRGDVNVNVMEAIVRVDDNWCPSTARLHMDSREGGVNVGVGTVSDITALSAWKRSALGLLPYFGVAFAIFAATGLVGATLARALKIQTPAPITALCAIGLTALALFFAYAVGPEFDYGAAFVVLLTLATTAMAFMTRDAFRQSARELAPAAGVWLIGGLAYFFLSGMTYNGLGHWEAAFRFSPAIWSSDNELPWMFAEGLRNRWDIPSLFGGNWLPSDRPPLMAGMHLMAGDVFSLMQSGNDGAWLRGSAYNAAAIAASTLWLPVFFVLLKNLFKLDDRRAMQATLLAALTPFFVFNSIYGWPKLLSAAFTGVALWAAFTRENGLALRSIVFGVACGLAIMCHASIALFLAPLALYFFGAQLWRSPVALCAGVVTGALVLAPWQLYQEFVLPTPNPLLKFALAGDFGFANPSQSVLEAVRTRYADMSAEAWLRIKAVMALQPFWPAENAGIMAPRVPISFGFPFADRLRNWDFYFLSAGNVGLLILAGVALVRSQSPARWLLALVAATFVLMLVAFLSPLILHQLPYGALMALALAGFGAAAARSPRLLWGLGAALALYTAVIWVLLPLRTALHVDGLACLGFAAAMWLATRWSFRGKATAAHS